MEKYLNEYTWEVIEHTPLSLRPPMLFDLAFPFKKKYDKGRQPDPIDKDVLPRIFLLYQHCV